MNIMLMLSLFIPIFYLSPAFADCEGTYDVSLAMMDKSAVFNKKTKKQEGAYIQLLNFLESKSSLKFDKIIYPFERSIENVISKKSDLHIPLIKNPMIPEKQLPYYLSNLTLFEVPFVLYTNKTKDISLKNIKKHSLATDSAHTGFFPFKMSPTHCISCAIKMVNKGRLDGFIFAQAEVDHYIKEFKLTNIRRQLYKNFEVKLVFPKTPRGFKLKECFEKEFSRLKDTGFLKKHLSPVVGEYDNWQP